MKLISVLKIMTLGLLAAQPSFAASTGDAKLFGNWNLETFTILSQDGSETPFCASATGMLIYEKTGHMSVSINCAPTSGASTGERVPADDFNGMLFYAGSFEIQGNSVVHHIRNSSHTDITGKDFVRKVEVLTDQKLVLTGAFGGAGQTLRIEWSKQATTPSLATDEQLAVLTYLKLKPGTEADFQKEFEKIITASRSEPGNVAWYVQKSQDDPSEIVFYTRWINKEALDAHLKSQPLADYIANTAGMLAPGYPKLVRYSPID